VETGEFGGDVGDDTDLYQNFADFPFLEAGGVGGRLRETGIRLAQLADRTTLVDGVNRSTMDPLHAYEKGLNHEALMAAWHYGDPVLLERCMLDARSVATEQVRRINTFPLYGGYGGQGTDQFSPQQGARILRFPHP